ncbi:MAG: hypothetical protein ACLU06_05370 [Eggerthellaceae bacterium]
MAFEPIQTQEELDAIIKKRIERDREKITAEVSGKYSDYDELAEKAKAYDEAQEAQKSEVQKAQEKIAQLESDIKKRDEADKQREMRAKVAKETGIPESLIQGTDEESMKAYAAQVAEFAKVQTPAAPKDPNPGKFSSGEGTNDEQREFARALLGKD